MEGGRLETSSIISEFSGKVREKLKEDQKNIKERFGMDWFKNQRHDAILEIAQKHWPNINDLSRTPAKRVSDLDELIHATALFSGRIKQNPSYGQAVMHWENLHGIFENFMMLNMEGMLDDAEAEDAFSPVITLHDGTKIRIKMGNAAASILSKKEQLVRDALFANTEIIPYGKFVYDVGVSDDRDIAPQYVLSLTTGMPQMGAAASKANAAYSPDFFAEKPDDKK